MKRESAVQLLSVAITVGTILLMIVAVLHTFVN